jgi:DNA mismatch endonuclease, patch repair protein
MDVWSKAKRSEVMSKIRSKDTRPEILLRKVLFSKGYRYRLHNKDLPGKPDIVLSRYKTVIFVHGCFWHYHRKCREGRIPDTNTVFWKTKLSKNINRDEKNKQSLIETGWHVITVWECEIEKHIDSVLDLIEHSLRNQSKLLLKNSKALFKK